MDLPQTSMKGLSYDGNTKEWVVKIDGEEEYRSANFEDSFSYFCGERDIEPDK